MKVAVIIHNGVFRVHADGCADVLKEATRYHDTPWVFDAKDRHSVNLACWGDVATDTTESGTQAWEKLCDEYASSETKFLPCIKALPETADDEPQVLSGTRVILLKPGEKPQWLQLPPSFELHARGQVIRKAVGGNFECVGGGDGWLALGAEEAKQRGDAVNTAYLPLFRRIGGHPNDLVAGPVLLCGLRDGDEVTPDERLRPVFGDLWPQD